MRRVAAVAAVLMLGVLFAIPVHGQESDPGSNLGGYNSLSSAMAFSFQPYLPALVSTGDVPFEGTIGLATSHVKSGGNAFGRGALIWPGSTAADLGPVLGVAFGQPQLGSLIPKWPLQAQATQGDGEVNTGVAPFVAMKAVGRPDLGQGDTRIGDINIPGVLHIEHISSISTSAVTDSSTSSTTKVELHGVAILNGHITAETIRSTSTTSSLGSAATSSGDVDIIGLKIGGIAVSVTDNGFQVDGLPPDAGDAPGAGGEPFPNQSPEEAVNGVLAALGAKITLFNSISSVVGGKAEHMEPGVIVSVNNPVGGTGPIPPGRFDIALAASSSSSSATLPFSLGDVGGSTGGETSSGDSSSGGGSISIGDNGVDVGGNTVGNVGQGLGSVATGPLGSSNGSLDGVITQHAAYKFGGIPIGLLIALLLLAVVIARFVRNAMRPLMLPVKGDDG